MTQQGRGTVRLVNAVFYAHHGVLAEEHRLGGRFEVDVSLEVNFEDAARRDDLSGTVDYVQVYALIRELVIEHKFFLIERLAFLIAERILDSNPNVQVAEITVRKPNPPVGGTCDRAEVIYRRERA